MITRTPPLKVEAPGSDAGLRTAAGSGVGVQAPVRGDLGAELAREVGAQATGVEDCDALLLADFHGGQRNGTAGSGDQDVDLVLVDPAPGRRRGDVRLQLRISVEYLDGCAVHLAAEILDGPENRLVEALADRVGVGAGHVVQNTDLDDPAGDGILGLCRCQRRRQRDGRHQTPKNCRRCLHFEFSSFKYPVPRRRYLAPRLAVRCSPSNLPDFADWKVSLICIPVKSGHG